MISTVVLTSALCALAIGANACDLPLTPTDWVDPPVEISLSDGRFEEASSSYLGSYSGEPVEDLGANLVLQQMSFSSACTTTGRVLVVDCQSTLAFFVLGYLASHDRFKLGDAGNFLESADYFFGGDMYDRSYRDNRAFQGYPSTGETTVSALLAEARERGVVVDFEVDKHVARLEPHNRYDPYIGCKIHYPNSAGASS